jgi:hypothetical protein
MAEEEIKEEGKEGVKEEIEKVGKSVLVKLGFWCFLIGVLAALVVGLVYGYGVSQGIDYQQEDSWGYIATMLAILGLIVGLVSVLGFGTITEYEVTKFLVASVAVVVVGAGGAVAFGDNIPVIGLYLEGITLALLLFFAPAAVIIALKALWDIGKD